MDDVFIDAWIASVPGVGPKRFASLQRLFPNHSFLLTCSKEELQRAGVPEKLACSVVTHQEKHTPDEIAQWCEKNSVIILSQRMSEYPSLLREIADPPVILYMKGELPSSTQPTVAVVGTRHITTYGTKVTQELTRELVRDGCVIVSGFMYGVDAVAHKACIDADGITIAVLGYGLGVPFYPRSHEQLAKTILVHGGCLLTEFPPWQWAVPGNFPSRNRIVSGLSLGVVVTEAASKSGSKITAQCAVDQGREVFAVPGPMNSPYSEGTKELVNMGAKLVTSADDIFEELPGSGQRTAVPLRPDYTKTVTGKQGFEGHSNGQKEKEKVEFATDLEASIYQFLEENIQATSDDLLQYSSVSARELAHTLSKMELDRIIRSDGSGTYTL